MLVGCGSPEVTGSVVSAETATLHPPAEVIDVLDASISQPPPPGPSLGPSPWFYGDAGHAIVWVAEGDSMTHPNTLPDGSTWPAWEMYPSIASALLGRAVSGSNWGSSGDTLAGMIVEEPYTLGPRFVDGGVNVVSILGGTNDMHSYDAGPSDVIASVKTYAAWARAHGWLVVVATLPRPDAFVVPAEREAFNAELRSSWPTFADGLVDLDADPALADMVNPDNVHPTEDGHERIAAHFAAVVRSVLIDAGVPAR